MKIGAQITLEDLKQLEKEAALEKLDLEKIKARKREIEECISNLSEENADRLIKMFDGNEIYKYGGSDGISYIVIWIEMFAKEREYNIEHTIFTGRKSIQEVMSIWRKAYFLLWRMEYESEEELVGKEEFWEFLQEQKFSIIALQYLLLTKSAYLDKTVVWLARKFLKEKDYKCANILIGFLEKCVEERKNIRYALNSDQI